VREKITICQWKPLTVTLNCAKLAKSAQAFVC